VPEGIYPRPNAAIAEVSKLVAVIATLVFVQSRMRQTDVVGFVLAGVVLTMGAALRLFVHRAGSVRPPSS
jgi:Kef-type K+ transport system membrane component KefB